MIPWISAAIIGLMIAALHYGRSPRLLPATLRAIAATLIAAMLFSAPSGPARPARPLVALDVSSSWTRGDTARDAWTRAAATARALAAGDSIVLFGDSARAAAAPPRAPGDRHSSLGPVLDAARETHRPLMIVSDGEFTDGATLPAGTRLTTIARRSLTDAAVVALDAPSRAAPGDTIPLRATIRAGSRPLAAATLTVSIGDGAPRTVALGPLGAFAEREASLTVVAPRGEREELVRAVVTTAGDGESRNDTLATYIEITRAPAAVVVSSSPDPDVRAALEALSGALVARPRGFYEVAPGAWRDATTLEPVTAAAVRAAAAAAPLLVLHGDTALFGEPARFARAALVLMIPGETSDAEWRAFAGDVSPLAPSLAGIAWDSIPPIELPPSSPHGGWTALEARSVGLASRVVVAGGDTSGHRRVVVAASGLWRWRARGGPSRDAYDALWGAIADWTTRMPVDARAVLPTRRSLREGDAVSWTRTGADSVIPVTLRRVAAPAGAPDSAAQALTLHFSGDAPTASTPPLASGRYVATMRGGSASFVVNAAAELLPARPTNHQVARGAPSAGVPAPPLGERWWPYAAALAALCGEWIIRRRIGLR